MNETSRTELEQIKEIIRNTVDPEGIYLFGSFAYGEPREDSDYDIYVVLPDDGPRPLEAIFQIRMALLPVQKRPFDILADYASNFHDRRQGPTLEREIYQKGELLYRQQANQQRVV